jgi:micrococcal nuclease
MDYSYRAKILRVIDGDTFKMRVDLGLNIYTDITVRLYEVNTPETWGVKKDSQEYRNGMAAKKFVEDWIEENKDENGYLFVETIKDKKGKYGRYLVRIWDSSGSIQSLNEAIKLKMMYWSK